MKSWWMTNIFFMKTKKRLSQVRNTLALRPALWKLLQLPNRKESTVNIAATTKKKTITSQTKPQCRWYYYNDTTKWQRLMNECYCHRHVEN